MLPNQGRDCTTSVGKGPVGGLCYEYMSRPQSGQDRAKTLHDSPLSTDMDSCAQTCVLCWDNFEVMDRFLPGFTAPIPSWQSPAFLPPHFYFTSHTPLSFCSNIVCIHLHSWLLRGSPRVRSLREESLRVRELQRENPDYISRFRNPAQRVVSMTWG